MTGKFSAPGGFERVGLGLGRDQSAVMAVGCMLWHIRSYTGAMVDPCAPCEHNIVFRALRMPCGLPCRPPDMALSRAGTRECIFPSYIRVTHAHPILGRYPWQNPRKLDLALASWHPDIHACQPAMQPIVSRMTARSQNVMTTTARCASRAGYQAPTSVLGPKGAASLTYRLQSKHNSLPLHSVPREGHMVHVWAGK